MLVSPLKIRLLPSQESMLMLENCGSKISSWGNTGSEPS